MTIDLIPNTGIQTHTVALDDDEIESTYGVSSDLVMGALRAGWNTTSLPYVHIQATRRGTRCWFTLAIDTNDADGNLRRLSEASDTRDLSVVVRVQADNAFYEVTLATLRFLDGAPIRMSLVLDIGNTRTCGLTFEESEDGDPVDISRLRPMSLQSDVAALAPLEVILESTIEFLPREWPTPAGQYRIDSVTVNSGPRALLKRLFGYHPLVEAGMRFVSAKSFEDGQLAAIGSDAIAWRRLTGHPEPASTGLSSPKRYLWSATPVPTDWKYALRPSPNGTSVLKTISSEILHHVPGDDSDRPLDVDTDLPVAPRNPTNPRYPRRTMMVFFVYELLRRVFQSVNSWEYRKHSRSPNRPRFVTDLVLTFPSAMSGWEIDRLGQQARKAVRLFRLSADGAKCPFDVDVHVDWDEGLASQFCVLAGHFGTTDGSGWGTDKLASGVVVASLDFGGGTVDLGVARYKLGPAHGEILCRVVGTDGVFVGGDDLVRLLIERLILPALLKSYGRELGASRLQEVFSKRASAAERAQRVRYLRGFLVPMAHAVLASSSNDNGERVIAATDVGDPDARLELSEFIFGVGDKKGELENWEFEYEDVALSQVVDEVLGPAVRALSAEITTFSVDTVVLAGRLSTLPRVKELVKECLSGGPTVVPFNEIPGMKDTCAQVFDSKDVDPKVSVALGAGLALICKQGRSRSGFRLTVERGGSARTFHWGFMDPQSRRLVKRLLGPPSKPLRISVAAGRYYIGRRLRWNGNARPVGSLQYRLEVNSDQMLTFEAQYDPALDDEVLSVIGNGSQLIPQSSISETYWLDSGHLATV